MIGREIENRRECARVRSRLRVWLRHRAGRAHLGLTRDVAAGGLGIETRFDSRDQWDPLVNWSGNVHVTIEFPSGQSVRAEARVVWWRLDVEGIVDRYRAGLRFIRIPAAGRSRLEELATARASLDARASRAREAGSVAGAGRLR